jgi:hypothetical protein
MVKEYRVEYKEEETKKRTRRRKSTVYWSQHIYRNQEIMDTGSIANSHWREKFCPDLLVGSACC